MQVVIFVLLILTTYPLILDAKPVEIVLSHEGRPVLIEVDPYLKKIYYGFHHKDESFYIKILNEPKEIRLYEENFNVDDVKLAFTNDFILIFYRIKEKSTGYKYVKLRKYNRISLELIEEKRLNTEKDALIPLNVFTSESSILVTWPDERFIKFHKSYYTYSKDSGKTFENRDFPIGNQDYMIANINYLNYDKKHCFIGFTCVMKHEKPLCGIYNFKASDLGEEFEIEAIDTENFPDWSPSIVKALKTKDGVLVIWAGAKGIYYAHNYTNNTWVTKSFPIDYEIGVSRLSIAKDKNENLYVVTSYKKLFDNKAKETVYLFISNDHGKSWSNPIQIRHYPFNSTMAINPDIYIDERDYIYIFWQDHRNIRGDIYMNYSKDGGKTWLQEDINLSQTPPGSKNDMYPIVKGIGNKVYLFWYQAIHDAYFGDRKLIMREINIK